MTSAKAWVSAIFAGLSAGLASLAVVLVGDMTLADLTQGQWLAVAIAVVSAFGGAFGLTYSVTNKPAAPPRVTVNTSLDGYDLAKIGRRIKADASSYTAEQIDKAVDGDKPA